MIGALVAIGYGLGILLAWRPCARTLLADFCSIGDTGTADVVFSLILGLLVAAFWPLVAVVAVAYYWAGPWFFPEFYAERRRKALEQARARVASLERELGMHTSES